MTTRRNEARALIKHIQNGCACRFKSKKCNPNVKCEFVKPIKHTGWKKSYSQNPCKCVCECNK